MIKCLICERDVYCLICINCKNDPFKIEDCRKLLANKNEVRFLKKLYDKSLPEIKDLNSNTFWSFRLKEWEKLKNQDGMTKRRVKIVASYLPLKEFTILDLGIGHGFLEQYINQKKTKYKVFGLDVSEKAVLNLRENLSGNFEKGSIYSYNFGKNKYDIIVALEVLEHIPPSKIFKFLEKVKCLLKKNGYLIISVPLNEGLRYMEDNPNGHVREYSFNLLKKELEISGFKIIQYEKSYAFKNLYFLKNILSKTFLKHRWQPNNVVVKAIQK